MRSVKYLIIPLLFNLLSFTAYSLEQDAWSLEECIEYAHLNNLQIKQQQLVIEQAQNDVLQAKLNFIPATGISITHNITGSFTQTSSANLSASMPLLQGLSKTNALKSNKAQLLISQYDKETLKNDITISITQAFLQILLSQEICKCAEESYNSVDMQVERTKQLVEAGRQAYSTLLDIKSQLSNERVKLVSAYNDVKNNNLTLVQLLDLPQDSDFTIKIPNTEKLMESCLCSDIESAYCSALALPQMRSAEMVLKKSRYDYKIQKGNLYPSISFSAGYGTSYCNTMQHSFFSQFNYNRNPSIGLSMSIPIFNGWRAGCAVRNAHLNIRKNELEVEKYRQQLYKDIVQAHTNASNAYAKYLAAEQNMKASKESFNHVEHKFNIGMLNGTDYIIAKTNLSQSESEYCRAKFQYLFQLKVLDLYKGIPITL